MKKMISFLMVMICFVGLFSITFMRADAKTSMTEKTLTLNDASIKQFSIELTKCHVQFKKAEDEKITCDYDKKLFEVLMSDEDGKVSVSIKGKSDKSITAGEEQYGLPENLIVKLYLPSDLEAEKVTIDADHAGVQILQVPRGDIEIQGENVSMEYQEPENNKDEIDVHVTHCNFTIHMQKKDDPGEVMIESSQSNITCPDKYRQRTEEKDARVHISAENSNFTLTTEKLSGEEFHNFYAIFEHNWNTES